MALEANVALVTHDHAGITGGTSRLLQMNTHQNADTDSSTSSLHHTLGSGATQAAQGNHGHTTQFNSITNLQNSVFGSTSRTSRPVCEVYYEGGPVYIGGDIFAQGGWNAVVDTDGMFSRPGGFSAITIPFTGRWSMHFHAAGTVGVIGYSIGRITRNSANVNASLAVASFGCPFNTAVELSIDAYAERVLPAGDRLYWGNWGSSPWTLHASNLGMQTFMTVRYVGPN